MNYYKIVIETVEASNQCYKGIARTDDYTPDIKNPRAYELWRKYVSSMGYITTELSMAELLELRQLMTEESKKQHEIIVFSERKITSNDFTYYGIDVSSFGGYSILGEGLFNNSISHSTIIAVLNIFFKEQLNEYGLFQKAEIAECFKSVLLEMNEHSPGCIEDEDWKIIYVYGV